MKAQEKPKYVQEARELLDSINIDTLIKNSNSLQEIKKINRLIAIFTNFSYNDGQELRRLFLAFQKWARSSSHTGIIQNRAVDMMQFIGQKIEEMDIYVIEDIEEKQTRIVKKLKNENLWARAGIENKDLHILIGERKSKSGEHVHLIVDSETGEIRIDPEDKSPHGLIEKVVSVTTKEGSTVKVTQRGVKATLEFLDETIVDNAPVLYTTNSFGKTGGSRGHFVYFTIKNIGKETALDIKWEVRGFAYSWPSKDEQFELEPGQSKEVEYPISAEKPFNDLMPELNIVMEYKDVKGRSYFTRRELKQEKVPSGAFYELKASTFHSPSIMVDDGLDLISGPSLNGDRYEAEFKINTEEGIKKAKIGISRTFLAVWNFSEDEQVKQALLELGHRKMRKMAREGNVEDYIFITDNFPSDYQNGFNGYVKLRDNL